MCIDRATKCIGNVSRQEMTACLEPEEVWGLQDVWPLLPLPDLDHAPPTVLIGEIEPTKSVPTNFLAYSFICYQD